MGAPNEGTTGFEPPCALMCGACQQQQQQQQQQQHAAAAAAAAAEGARATRSCARATSVCRP
eukprot:6351753-Prymnesium_polylepis.1